MARPRWPYRMLELVYHEGVAPPRDSLSHLSDSFPWLQQSETDYGREVAVSGSDHDCDMVLSILSNLATERAQNDRQRSKHAEDVARLEEAALNQLRLKELWFKRYHDEIGSQTDLHKETIKISKFGCCYDCPACRSSMSDYRYCGFDNNERQLPDVWDSIPDWCPLRTGQVRVEME